MAQVPTIDETVRAIFEAIAKYGVRAGENVPLMGIQMDLDQQGYRADDINPALQAMIERGFIAGSSSGKFIKLTETGFEQM